MARNRSGIVLTAALALVFGCCALATCLSSVLGLVNNGDVNFDGTPDIATGAAVGLLFLTIVFIAIPVIAGLRTLRR